MRILLVQPPKPGKSLGGEDFSLFEPLALEYLAAAVAGDHDVRILDMRLDKDLDTCIGEYEPDVVGITSYTVHVNTVKRLFERVKARDAAIVTIVGGHHATILPEDFVAPFIDVIIRGEGVLPFREVIRRLERERGSSGIRGAVRREDGPLVIAQSEHEGGLDDLPFPRRDLTAKYRTSYFSEWMKPLASIRTSKGCHFRCTFCALWKLTGGRYLTRKPECIVEELGSIGEKYVFFSDDESLLDAERMKELADRIRRAGIRKRYFLYGRSDTIARHPELIEQWKKVGLERIFIGLEFFRDADLKAIRKGSTAATNTKAVQVLKELEIDMFPMFIVKPEFNRTDFADLKKYCRGLDLDFVGFSVLTPLPGTDFYNEVRERLLTSNYDYFDFFHTLLPTALPAEEFYKEMAALYKDARSLKNQIKFMRKYPLREYPALFRTYNDFMRRLGALGQEYAVNSDPCG
ncbi:MAG: cobalamin-dependent protein [Nitrospirales bacterium]|nr:cobalamin-dependent protein [Nitrospirales bacterium]